MAAAHESEFDHDDADPNLDLTTSQDYDDNDDAIFQTKSDCGFPDGIHDMIMAAGQAVHGMFGEPPSVVGAVMRETGDFVKDTAVALHDFDAGVVREETQQLIKMMTSKSKDDSQVELTDSEDDKNAAL